jgi:aconitate hydratase
LTQAYYQEQGLWYSQDQEEPVYTDQLELDLSQVEACLAGPSRPQDRVSLSQVKSSFQKSLLGSQGKTISVTQPDGQTYPLGNGSVVIAAITSCTNTSNPSVLIAAGLLAKNAVERGLQVKPWVKTSLAPGSKVVTDYLIQSGLMPHLEALRFNLAGYGCTTCIGNSGPLPNWIGKAIVEGELSVAAVLSGNRNFEGRIHAWVRANYLASPPLVVAYALAGNINLDLTQEPVGIDPQGKPVFLREIWPTQEQIQSVVKHYVNSEQFRNSYSEVFSGSQEWKDLPITEEQLYPWDENSTYIKEPPFFDEITHQPTPPQNIQQARVLVFLGDSITTDHISPAGSFGKPTPAGQYLLSQGVQPESFNSYGARRGNHEVMVRGTFANIRLKNFLTPGIEGGVTQHFPSGQQLSIYDASMRYQADKVPLIVIAGKEYGTGSSRDWAAKGPKLLGIRAVIAESFERIHRSNLVGMGILPLQFLPGESAQSLGLDGTETFDINGLAQLQVSQKIEIKVHSQHKKERTFLALLRIDTPNEVEYFRHGGILPYVLRQLSALS